jgi:hypothetical protein
LVSNRWFRSFGIGELMEILLTNKHITMLEQIAFILSVFFFTLLVYIFRSARQNNLSQSEGKDAGAEQTTHTSISASEAA